MTKRRLEVLKHFQVFPSENYNFRISQVILERVPVSRLLLSISNYSYFEQLFLFLFEILGDYFIVYRKEFSSGVPEPR